eukprot:TRINITY_DN73590_c0_g1_i1.p1 TRINITY_DN73590_c0_g1~~TRINITY_DN73590_c0_g1_i1.p1  ORF type:complete len:928 (+),score=142.93 TRINITY_DN73590_c0_g1_i1:69-2852(+)
MMDSKVEVAPSAAESAAASKRKPGNLLMDDGLNGQDVSVIVDGEENTEVKNLLNRTVTRMVQNPDKVTVTKRDVLKYIKECDRRNEDSGQCPCLVLFFVFCALSVWFHEDIGAVSQVERHFRNMLEGTSFEGTLPSGRFVSGHKTLTDIDTIADIWTYLNDAFVPLFIGDTSSRKSEHVHRALRYNQVIGGIRLKQIRRKSVMCDDFYTDLGPKRDGKNYLIEDFKCFPYDAYTSDCFGQKTGDAYPEGFCPLEKTGRRLMESHGGAIGKKGQVTTSWYSSALAWAKTIQIGATHMLRPSSYVQDLQDEETWFDGRKLQSSYQGAQVRGDSFAASIGYFDGGVYSIGLNGHDGLNKVLGQLAELREKEWIDLQTAWLGMNVFILNPDLGVYTHIVTNVWFPSSGELIPAVRLSSFPADTWKTPREMGVDLVWLVTWLHLFFYICIRKLVHAIRRKKVREWILDFWTWLNWIACAGGWVVMGLFMRFVLELNKVQDDAVEVVLSRPSLNTTTKEFVWDTPAQEAMYKSNSLALDERCSELSVYLMYSRLFVTQYVIVIMLRFFKVFLAQPKLAIVTMTILRSLTDAVHFLIVLVIFLAAYSFSGMFLFGHRMFNFSQPSYAFMTCIGIMFGDFDFEALIEDHLLIASLWFFSYVILVAIIMLNMCLAIIMDIYGAIKMAAENQDPIWTQAYKLVRGSWQEQEWVKSSIIEEIVRKMDVTDDTKLDRDMLMRECPALSEAQAKVFLGEADKMVAAEEQQYLGISDAMKIIGWIKIAFTKLTKQLEDITALETSEKAMNQVKKKLLADKAAREAENPSLVTANTPIETDTTEWLKLGPLTDTKLGNIDKRMEQMEKFLDGTMLFAVHRGKEMRNRLEVIESLMKGEGDTAPPPGAGVFSTTFEARLASREGLGAPSSLATPGSQSTSFIA